MESANTDLCCLSEASHLRETRIPTGLEENPFNGEVTSGGPIASHRVLEKYDRKVRSEQKKGPVSVIQGGREQVSLPTWSCRKEQCYFQWAGTWRMELRCSQEVMAAFIRATNFRAKIVAASAW